MIAAIVAVDNNWGIGFEGQLLEHLPPDMKYFKEKGEQVKLSSCSPFIISPIPREKVFLFQICYHRVDSLL